MTQRDKNNVVPWKAYAYIKHTIGVTPLVGDCQPPAVKHSHRLAHPSENISVTARQEQQPCHQSTRTVKKRPKRIEPLMFRPMLFFRTAGIAHGILSRVPARPGVYALPAAWCICQRLRHVAAARSIRPIFCRLNASAALTCVLSGEPSDAASISLTARSN